MNRPPRLTPRFLFLLSGCALALALPVLASTAAQAPVFLPDPPATVDVTQRIGGQIPLPLRFADEGGKTAPLSHTFDGSRPVLLVPGYARCVTLCGLAMQTLLRTLSETGLSTDAYRVLRIGLDPGETPEMAQAQTQAWRKQTTQLRPAPAMPEVRRGDAANTRALLASMGMAVVGNHGGVDQGRFPTNEAPAIAHPTIVVIATPQGRIHGYVGALDHDPSALRREIVAAAEGRLGTPMERLALRCAHLDPSLGRHSAAVLAGLQGLGLASCLWLGAWLWRHRHGHSTGGSRP